MNLRTERERLGISQVNMAAGIGVCLNTYINWERKVTKPNPENKAKLIKFLMKEDDKKGA